MSGSMSEDPGRVIAVLGAESTGKTSLVAALAEVLRGRGLDVETVPEALRLFCDRQGRTPHAREQAGLAQEQSAWIDAAARHHALVLTDTTALMTAVYSEVIFGDGSLYPDALEAHGRSHLTLLMATDLPWVPDGLMRDGPQVRERVDAALRAALQRAALPHAVVMGLGDRRVGQALSVIDHLLEAPERAARAARAPRWRWYCDNCDDGECEQHWLTRARLDGAGADDVDPGPA